MRSVLTLTVALCALFAVQATATAQSALRESEFQITPRAGIGNLRIDRFEGVGINLEEKDTHGIGVGFGFLTPIGVVLEAGAEVFGDENWFDTEDSFSLRQQFISLGYQFELGNGWRIVPRVGRAHWKLRTEEGAIFDFDDDNDSREVSGNDYYWEASVSRRISRVVTLGLNVKQGNYDFGRSRSAAFLVTLGF
jgi:hypothetical protein